MVNLLCPPTKKVTTQTKKSENTSCLLLWTLCQGQLKKERFNNCALMSWK